MMTSEVPKVSRTGRYTVNKTCEALGISRSKLYHIPEALLPFTGEKRHRRYHGDKILRYWYLVTR
jgi:hypothetical protein